jgi:hypothetical protein
LKEIFHQTAEKWSFEILALRTMPGNVHLFVKPCRSILLHLSLCGVVRFLLLVRIVSLSKVQSKAQKNGVKADRCEELCTLRKLSNEDEVWRS